ncbi:MAG: hypothetical protein FJ098_13190, partial [Deltaproteobacteria bacterium]|nr:hypothetical protein [Deltaproteobacteria bacterium]
EVPSDATVHLQYHLAADPSWWEIEATPAATSTPGYRSFEFTVSEHLFGPGTGDGLVIELVPFLRFPDGHRVFDHNRFAGDLENHVLGPDGGFQAGDGGVCQPVVGWVDFLADWQETVAGERRQGGYLQVGYDLSRLPDCRGTHNGHPAWNTVAYARFHPGGQLLAGSVRSFVTVNGQPTNEAVAVPFVVPIPADAEEVELWFQNFTGAGSSCVAWDSNFGENYRYGIWPSAEDPRCLDVEREDGMNTEDPRMVHMSPWCLPYDLAGQYDAGYCEFWVDGFGDGHMGHYGIPLDWLVAYLKTGANDGEVLNAGMYTAFHDEASGQPGERFSLGLEVSPGVWKTGFAYYVTGFQGVSPVDVAVDGFAFFLDVRRPTGEVVRLWQSQGGANYAWDDAFGLPTVLQYIPYGNIRWAADAAPVLESRAACASR